jgi:hypothetical protein
MTENNIKELHPSLCYNCIHARKPASDANIDKGYVGCAEYCRKQTYGFISEFKEIAEGWVDLRASIFGPRSGITTNFQLLALEVSKCTAYLKKT